MFPVNTVVGGGGYGRYCKVRVLASSVPSKYCSGGGGGIVRSEYWVAVFPVNAIVMGWGYCVMVLL